MTLKLKWLPITNVVWAYNAFTLSIYTQAITTHGDSQGINVDKKYPKTNRALFCLFSCGICKYQTKKPSKCNQLQTKCVSSLSKHDFKCHRCRAFANERISSFSSHYTICDVHCNNYARCRVA